MITLLLDSWLATLEDEMPLKQEIQALKEALEKAELENKSMRQGFNEVTYILAKMNSVDPSRHLSMSDEAFEICQKACGYKGVET